MKFETFHKMKIDQKLDVLFIVVATMIESELGNTLHNIIMEDLDAYEEGYKEDMKDRQNAIKELNDLHE